MRWPKFISTILHPIVIPTIGIILYFILTPVYLSRYQQYTLLGVVFVATYIIPILLLIFLKAVKYIESYEVHGIKERKIPVFFMMSLLFLLGKFFSEITIIKDLSYLFFGVVFGLGVIYILFSLKIKASLHLLSLGAATGYFLLFQQIHNITTLPLIIVLILLSGLSASARLHLKAHTIKEVYLGFFIGIASPFFAFYIL
ncbi:hypothetical protein J2Q11_04170 [Tenacibaculum finnmarkense genomovar finnmarkense]|uniref:PAP2 superfamily protein n=1 Tax=Tenacibaculum finnmarkense genomovar finnmarkense TaxID=1458503 RepID=A0AAP1RFZ7_9FLAO|nr:hypothetical protein [Tenacibaculum finnmarkense]MBE7653125.1 hypothetical protein [Tenacibaculum finnmarkense genomovar finnmarkense]MBE7660145.1 hypothetical protein [Tenacibaculum finnmarkense genomovar finnmarkense]MBE7692931.1 hypothetical protein [Tenacibaculum finnmarkense genomovar finnmarkense]MBE7695505.1 hypothetical protein [Tenacibaculum finnmarkense genomovar finnmarkense]MCD8403104.1 hypothetical protein [Tenacibaculum finnmarkense genomovar finnmarkense]